MNKLVLNECGQFLGDTDYRYPDGSKYIHNSIVFNRSGIAKRYSEFRLEIHLRIVMYNLEQFCTTFYRTPVNKQLKRLARPDGDGLLRGDLGDVNKCDRQVSMFVYVREFLKCPEDVISSVAWLHFGNKAFSCLTDPSKLPLALLFEFVGINEDRELVSRVGLVLISQNELPDHMVKSRTPIIEGISNDAVDTGRDNGRVCYQFPDVLSFIRIELVGDSIGLRIDERANFGVKSAAMFMRSCYLGLDTINSWTGKRDLIHTTQKLRISVNVEEPRNSCP